MEKYLEPLPKDISLQIFNGNDLIFQSSGKWLYPLFEFEDFLKTYHGSTENLKTHDSAIGKAAAALSVRFGIRKINADLLSENAKNYIEQLNASSKANPIKMNYSKLIPNLLCKTEELLKDICDSDEMYSILKERAGRD